MDALRIIMIIVASYVALASPVATVTPDTEPPETVSVTESEATTTPLPRSSLAPLPRNCSTARREAGVCAARQECDHSTGAIDLSLYRPSWYTSSCNDGEVCCPFHALIQQETQDNGVNDEFDDDIFE